MDMNPYIHKETHWDAARTYTYTSNTKGRRHWLSQDTTDRDCKRHEKKEYSCRTEKTDTYNENDDDTRHAGCLS